MKLRTSEYINHDEFKVNGGEITVSEEKWNKIKDGLYKDIPGYDENKLNPGDPFLYKEIEDTVNSMWYLGDMPMEIKDKIINLYKAGLDYNLLKQMKVVGTTELLVIRNYITKIKIIKKLLYGFIDSDVEENRPKIITLITKVMNTLNIHYKVHNGSNGTIYIITHIIDALDTYANSLELEYNKGNIDKVEASLDAAIDKQEEFLNKHQKFYKEIKEELENRLETVVNEIIDNRGKLVLPITSLVAFEIYRIRTIVKNQKGSGFTSEIADELMVLFKSSSSKLNEYINELSDDEDKIVEFMYVYFDWKTELEYFRSRLNDITTLRMLDIQTNHIEQTMIGKLKRTRNIIPTNVKEELTEDHEAFKLYKQFIRLSGKLNDYAFTNFSGEKAIRFKDLKLYFGQLLEVVGPMIKAMEKVSDNEKFDYKTKHEVIMDVYKTLRQTLDYSLRALDHKLYVFEDNDTKEAKELTALTSYLAYTTAPMYMPKYLVRNVEKLYYDAEQLVELIHFKNGYNIEAFK